MWIGHRFLIKPTVCSDMEGGHHGGKGLTPPLQVFTNCPLSKVWFPGMTDSQAVESCSA